MTLPARYPAYIGPPELDTDMMNDDGYDEAHLIELAQHNPALFAPIYEQYFERVYAYCLRRCENTQEAEDLCSQIFTRAMTGLHTYRGGVFAAWLFQIAHHVIVNHYRKARATFVPLDEIDLPYETDFDSVDQIEDGRILNQLMAALPDDQRDLLALTLQAELTSNEIGLIVGKSAGAVRTQVHRIIKGLRERYLQIVGDDNR